MEDMVTAILEVSNLGKQGCLARPSLHCQEAKGWGAGGQDTGPRPGLFSSQRQLSGGETWVPWPPGLACRAAPPLRETGFPGRCGPAPGPGKVSAWWPPRPSPAPRSWAPEASRGIRRVSSVPGPAEVPFLKCSSGNAPPAQGRASGGPRPAGPVTQHGHGSHTQHRRCGHRKVCVSLHVLCNTRSLLLTVVN